MSLGMIKNYVFNVTKDIRNKSVEELKARFKAQYENLAYDPEKVLPDLYLNSFTKKYIKSMLARITGYKEGILTKEEAICKVNPERFDELLFPQIEPKDLKAATMIAKDSAASQGAACGKVCFIQDEALAAKAAKEDAILVTVMTSQEDVKGMKACHQNA